jgi:predicted Zn-dependent protease
LKRPGEALGEFRRAAELEPDRARYVYVYVYAVALHSAGRRNDATAELKAYLNRRPKDRDILLPLVTFSSDGRDVLERISEKTAYDLIELR